MLQITPSSSKLQLAPFFRVADGQKPVRLSAASFKRASIQLASGRQSLALEKTKIEAVKDDAWKKRLQPRLDQINKLISNLDAQVARLAGVEEQAKALAAAAPLQFRIYYEIDADTQVDLVQAKAGGSLE